jgi:signal peptidase I
VKNLKRLWRHSSFLVVVIGLLAFRSSLADQYVVPTGSMEPTILPGDHVFVDKRAYGLRIPFTPWVVAKTGDPRRGEVVVFRNPRDPSRQLIKRLVGVPGDEVQVYDGFVRVNGVEAGVSAPRKAGVGIHYLETLDSGEHWVQRLPERTLVGSQRFRVPEGRYFFLGDNRDNSADSREWGYADRAAILGRAEGVLYRVRWKGMLPLVDFSRSGRRMNFHTQAL